MKILLVNPPNCGRSIPEERYGMDLMRQIFRGEPLALETLAGNLRDHEVQIADLKAEPCGFGDLLSEFRPDVVGFTALTCEANTVVRLAEQTKKQGDITVVVGGIHASNDPEFFNRLSVDYVVVGLGKACFSEMAASLAEGRRADAIPGVAKTRQGGPLVYNRREHSISDLVEQMAPRYDLVSRYRDEYALRFRNLKIGFVVSAFGCPYDCSFCSIGPQTDGRYLTCSPDAIIRDIGLLGDVPIIRLVDANTFGRPEKALELCRKIREAGIKKQFIADARSDTVVRHPELFFEWKKTGLRAVLIGLEYFYDARLDQMNKQNTVAKNRQAIEILHEIGITIVGDFIVSPDCKEKDFENMEKYVTDSHIDLPMFSILTPLPGTRLHKIMKEQILIQDLDYYTLTNAVTATQLGEEMFYSRYARLVKTAQENARL
jgi:radical SAM superfamily enzyme YgiQ (UPF0313 family)